jgi:predicted component of type VI protein secretion system
MQKYRLKGASGKVANQSFDLGQSTVIGSGPDCDLVLADEEISVRHAEIRMQDNGCLRLSHLDKTSEIFVNGVAVETASLGSGDEIRIGNYRWVLQAPGLRPEKVLTIEAVRQKRSYLSWLVAVALLATTALAWQRGWLPFI